MIKRPDKPFATYKWRWLSYAPTEGLLQPPVFLGVLRVLARHEDEAPTSAAIAKELAVVKSQTGTKINLARKPERNLIRNSGQYWKGTGLLLPDKGDIHLTPLGRKVAGGNVTQGEFAAIMVQQTVLPNPWTYSEQELAKWKAAGLEIRPLALILKLLEILGRSHGGTSAAFITPWELMRICIPLAGVKSEPDEIAEAIAQHRAGKLDVSNWPDCTPGANDHRLAKEFLLFLANFGLCRRIEKQNSMEDVYLLDELYAVQSAANGTTASIFTESSNTDAIIDAIRHSPLPSIIERQRTLTSVLARPGQSRFRETVFKAYSSRCFLTGDSMGEILEAAHIIPVTHGGADKADNGICLRVDIHRLFDSNNIRIKGTGELQFSDALRGSKNYAFLPHKITLPNFVNPANIRWRDSYS
jgi:HNH endonuclease